jgi:hypothetical protein
MVPFALYQNPPINHSFKEITDVLDLTKSEEKKQNSPTLQLSNNFIDSMANIPKLSSHLLLNPEFLCWLDLSFNHIARIDKVNELIKAIGAFQNLKVLYLHANKLSNTNDIDHLAPLLKLRNLTLHGNVMEHYKFLVLFKMPGLLHLDFSGITKQDRAIMKQKLIKA